MFDDDSISDLSVSCSAPIPPPLPPRLVRQPPIRRPTSNLNRIATRNSNRIDEYAHRVATKQTAATPVMFSAVEALSRGFVHFKQINETLRCDKPGLQ
jgi:hypothetical protein